MWSSEQIPDRAWQSPEVRQASPAVRSKANGTVHVSGCLIFCGGHPFRDSEVLEEVWVDGGVILSVL